jgi:hypothetical protein
LARDVQVDLGHWHLGAGLRVAQAAIVSLIGKFKLVT